MAPDALKNPGHQNRETKEDHRDPSPQQTRVRDFGEKLGNALLVAHIIHVLGWIVLEFF